MYLRRVSTQTQSVETIGEKILLEISNFSVQRPIGDNEK